MKLKSALRSIVIQISAFENSVARINQGCGLKYYSLSLSGNINPGSIEVRRKQCKKLVASFEITYGDAFPSTVSFNRGMKNEIKRLLLQDQVQKPNKWMKLSEIFKICREFGFPNYLVLGRPYRIVGIDGDILTIYMDYIGQHSDLYLRCKLIDPSGHLYIKVDLNELLTFLNGGLTLCDVLHTLTARAYYVENDSDLYEGAVRLPANYPIERCDENIGQWLDADQEVIQRAVQDFTHWQDIDSYGEEIWPEGEEIKKIIRIQ